MLLGERDVDAVVGGGGLELEVETATEAFAQGEAPGLVDSAAEGGVKDELHAAALVEETLGDNGGFGGDGAENGSASDDVGDQLLGSGGADATGLSEPVDGGGNLWLSGGDEAGRHVGSEGGDVFAEFAYAVGEDGSALGGFAEPEWDVGRGSVGVFDEDAASGFDTLDTPTGVAEEDDVAGAGVDSEVLVQGGYLYAIRLQYDVEEGGVGDGAAVGDGDHAGSATRMKMTLDGVVEEVGSVATAGGFDAIRE